MVACADMITACAETIMVACADMITAHAETNGCMCRHDHCIRRSLHVHAISVYSHQDTPINYVHADIVIETHGAPYERRHTVYTSDVCGE